MLDATELIRELVAIPGPPGQEEAVSAAVLAHVASLGYEGRIDAKGSLLVHLPYSLPDRRSEHRNVRVVVTAHLDEIGLMVSAVDPDGRIRVRPLGGLYPWKWGEQPVEILTGGGSLAGILSFGCIHTNSPASVAQQGRTGPLEWKQAYLFTGLSAEELEAKGVHAGVRVALAREQRRVREVGDYLVSYFLDDRADIAVMLLALEELRGQSFDVEIVFAATGSEEVGGEGALYLMHRLQPDVCIALEIGPSVPESDFDPDDQPTIWVTDSYSSIAARDMEAIAEVCRELGQRPHWQPLSRGGSDASCAASHGLAARPMTLGLPVENSHGLEIMHRDAPRELARLLVAYLKRLANE